MFMGSDLTMTLKLFGKPEREWSAMPVRQLDLNTRQKNRIHHIWYLLDESGSMSPHVLTLPKVMDAQVAALAEDSKNHPGEETRVSVFGFSSPGGGPLKPDYECFFYDKDVLHVPSISGMYRICHGTALCDAIVRTLDYIAKIPEDFGEHFHLLYVLTDGEELHSSWQGKQKLPGMIAGLPQNVSIGAFTPSLTGKQFLMRYGFPQGNIEIWDPSRRESVEEVGHAMAAATTGYMSSTRSGTATRTTSLFEAAAPKVADLKKNLASLTPGSYDFIPVSSADLARIENGRIDQFMELRTGRPFSPGRAYYEFTKRERVQGDKKIAVAIWDKARNEELVYMGEDARSMLGLPADGISEVRVSPGNWAKKGYKVYILSKSNNRKLVPGTRVLVVR